MVNNTSRCVIVAASPQSDEKFIASNLHSQDFVICADGGADILYKLGKTPNLMVGDFDSSEDYKLFESTDRVVLPISKDDTDTMACVKIALKRGFKNFLLLGAMGGRADHELANLSALLYLKKNNARGVISNEFGDILLLADGKNLIENMMGKTISIMPFACKEICVSYEGMKYMLDNSIIKTEYPYTISNVAVSQYAAVWLHSGEALLVLPRV